MIEGAEPIAAVLLPPGDKSRLPALFNYWLSATGVVGHYVPIWVEPDDLREVIATLPKVGFVGLHIGANYQKTVLDIADIVTDRAALMGAVNTLIFRRDGKTHGDNTDGYGFVENIRQSCPGWTPNAGPAAIFGAGPPARVVISALVELGVDRIRVASRTKPKAEQLRTEFGMRIEVVDWLQAGNITEDAATVINATPLGASGESEFRVPLDGLAAGAVVCDMVTDPPYTRFLQLAAQQGCFVADGAGMMMCQAAPSFERWFGRKPLIDATAKQAAYQ